MFWFNRKSTRSRHKPLIREAHHRWNSTNRKEDQVKVCSKCLKFRRICVLHFRHNIERKKEDLRQMVGWVLLKELPLTVTCILCICSLTKTIFAFRERYRDLIQAADTISDMKDSADMVRMVWLLYYLDPFLAWEHNEKHCALNCRLWRQYREFKTCARRWRSERRPRHISPLHMRRCESQLCVMYLLKLLSCLLVCFGQESVEWKNVSNRVAAQDFDGHTGEG